MENKTLSLQVVPAPASVQSGVEIYGVKFRHCFDDFYKLLKRSKLRDDEFDLVLSAFKKVYKSFSGEYIIELSPTNVRDGVMILEKDDSVLYSNLEEAFEQEMRLVNVYVQRSRNFDEILPERDFRPGLDFVTNLCAHVHSNNYFRLYSDGKVDIKRYECDDLRYIGLIFGNRRKFGDDPCEFLRYVNDRLKNINCWIAGEIYNVLKSDGFFVAMSSYLDTINNGNMVIYIDTSY